MHNQELEVLQPHYFKQFKCIGGECEDHCCKEWHVNIDKNSYEKYKAIDNVIWREKLLSNIKIDENNKAGMKLPVGGCSLLTKEGMCNLQLELGEGYLCDTCKAYPRVAAYIDNRLEKSLSLSCAEAARIALLNEAPMTFEINYETKEKNELAGIKIKNSYESWTKLSWKKYFWPLREFIIDLMQYREVSLEKRLMILGVFCDKLENLVGQDKADLTIELIEDYRNKISQGMFNNLFDNVTPSFKMQLELGTEIITIGTTRIPMVKSYKECLDQVIEGLKIKGKLSNEEKVENYINLCKLYYEPFLKEYDYILENYLVHYIFTYLMPINKETPFKSYMTLVIHYLLMKIHLVGAGAYHKGITVEVCVSVVQAVTKFFEHAKQYFNQALDQLDKKGYNTLGHMLVLICS